MEDEINEHLRSRSPDENGKYVFDLDLESSLPTRILCGDVWPKGSWTASKYAAAMSAASQDSAFLAVGNGPILQFRWIDDEPEPEITIIPIN